MFEGFLLGFNFHSFFCPENPGHEDKFKRLQKVYEVLSNEDKRKIYDRGGEEAIERGDDKI